MAENQFRPYRYIKEFYNVERLIMPSLRRHVLLHLFVGEADTPGDTLLDNMNYKFFDLWTMCINKYRYSFWETMRSELIVVPDMMSCIPPFCNVIFPDEYIHYGRSIKLRDLVTRFFEQGVVTTATDQDPSSLSVLQNWTQEAYVGPTSDIQPLMPDLIKAELAGKQVEENGETKFISFSQIPLPEELHYGTNIYTDEGEYLFKQGEEFDFQKEAYEQTGESSLTLKEEYATYHKLNVMYKYFLTRLQSQKTEQVTLTFTPRLVPGLPVLLLSRTGRHLFGLLTSLQHRISAQGEATTQCVIEYQYIYDDQTKRPLYLLRDRSPETKMNEENDYVWKNYFMLSNEFRDRNIGSYLYNTILSDEINPSDYNVYAKKIAFEKDKSLLLANKLFNKSLKKKNASTDELERIKEALDLTKKQGQEDDYYYAQDSPNSVRETYLEQIDASVSVNKDDKKLVGQMYNLYSAVNNIYGAYSSAFSKDQFKKQFDIYPLRDFDIHMASLGAERDINGDFKGVGEKIDWVKRIKDEINTRLKTYNDTLKKTGEEQKKNEETKKVNNKEKIRQAVNLIIQHAKDNGIGDLSKDDVINYVEYKEGMIQNVEDVYIFKKLDRNKDKFDFVNNMYNEKALPFIKTLGISPKTLLEDKLIEKETPQEKQTQPKNNTDKTILEREPNYDRIKESKNKEELLKHTKGEVVDEERKKQLDNLLRINKLDRKTSKLDGFTTIGPFCLEKQLYFKTIFRESISHFDTEFRDVTSENASAVKRVKANDRTELEDIIKMTHTKGINKTIETSKINSETSVNGNKTFSEKETNDINRIFNELVDLKIQALRMISSEEFVMHDFNDDTKSFNMAANSTALTLKLQIDGLGTPFYKYEDRFWLEWDNKNEKLDYLKRLLSDENRSNGSFYDNLLEYVCSRRFVYDNGSFAICKRYLDKLNEFYSKKGYNLIEISEEIK